MNYLYRILPFWSIDKENLLYVYFSSFPRSSGGGGSFPPPAIPQQQFPAVPRCVELSRLPAELLRPSAIEQFLRPTVPLSLSSVKVVYDQHGFPLHTLVRFDSPNDADRILARNGEQGIRLVVFFFALCFAGCILFTTF